MAPLRKNWLLIIAARSSRALDQAAALFRERLPRQLLVAVRRVVDERRDNDGVLHHVLRRHVLVDVHVGVVRAREVIDVVLHELEAGKAHGVECHVVGAAEPPIVMVVTPMLLSGSIQLSKIRLDHLVALQYTPRIAPWP